MIEELIHYLSAQTNSQGARRLGYVYEAAALQVRHRRCLTAWQTHIKATQQALIAAASRIETGGTALIVGAGCVQDLPISNLLAQFERLVLVDIVFTYQARRLASSWPGRVECCYLDVTGVVDWLAKRRCLPPPDRLASRDPLNQAIPDLVWVASVNCLTQLPILPVRWLHRFGVDESALEGFLRALIQAHLNWLKNWQVPVCLITEVEEQHLDQNGQVIDIIDHRSLLRDFQQNATRISGWNWTLHPPGELPNGWSETREVEAWSYETKK
jgi:hypothetical protein